MLAAALFFRDQASGDSLPYLEDYLLCEHFHWSWRDLAEMPKAVLDYFRAYRNAEAQVRAQEASQRDAT